MRLSLSVLLTLLVAIPCAAQPDVLPPSNQWVTDAAGILTETERRSLEQKLSTYADTTSSQIVIVTVPSLGGAAASEYAVELGRRWGIGQQEYDNGLVILVSRDDREVFIATGYGLEGAVPDALAGRIVRNVMVPNFREGRYYAGLTEAVNIIMSAAAGEYQAIERTNPDQPPAVDFATIFVLLIIAFFIINGISSGRGGGGGGRRRYRRGFGGPPIIIWGGGRRGGFGGGGFGGGGFGGFSGGGGSFGGGGAGGSW